MFCFVTYWHSRPHQDTHQPEKEDVTKRVIHDSFWWFYWMIIGNFGDYHEPQYQGTRRRQQSCRWDTWGSSSRGLLAHCTTTIATLLCINVSFMISIIFLYHYQARAQSARARSARALRALRLLLADGTPTVGGGKTFWRVSRIFFTETAVTPDRKVEKSFPRWEINRHVEG